MDEELEPAEAGSPAWMTSFSDMMVLMLCFFVLLTSFAKTDRQTFRAAAGSVREAFGIKPKATPLESPAGSPPNIEAAVRARALDTAEAREQARVAAVKEFLAARGLEDQVEVSAGPRGITLRTKDQILFDSAAATLERRGAPVLNAVRELTLHFQGQLAVEGHSDDRPIQNANFPSNWELSGARSAAVLRYLVEAGVDPALVHVAGYAHTRPVATNATDEGRAQNRRVEFVFEYSEANRAGAPPQGF